MKKCTLYCENTDFAINAVSVTNFAVFYAKNVNFKKLFYLPLSLSPPTNNSQARNCDDSSRNATCSAKTMILLKMQFQLLILPFFTLKMRILKNSFIFLFLHLPTTHKPTIVMTHEEMYPVLRKN